MLVCSTSSNNAVGSSSAIQRVNGFRQLALPTFDRGDADERQSPGQRPQQLIDQDPLVPTYLRRLKARGTAPKGFAAYRYQLESVLRTASRLRGAETSLGELFHDPELLGRVLVDDSASSSDGTLSKWTLAQRRSAVRSFGSLMRPELHEVLSRDPLERIDEALQTVAERIGTGYRLTGGTPRRRGGYVPTPNEVAMVVDAAGNVPGYRGIRNRVFFEILAKTGTRVNALRNLNGDDCIEMPSGRLRIFVHDKGKLEPREIELTRELSSRLLQYINAFNQLAAGRRWKTRIHLGAPEPIWRNSSRGRWPYQAILATLQQACTEAGAVTFSPHALRRTFATDAASALPRHVVALAGGWQGLERLDDHYVHPRQHAIWNKLGWGMAEETSRRTDVQVEDEPVIAL